MHVTTTNKGDGYRPVGDVYEIGFIDEAGYSWDHFVIVPHNAGVETALKHTERAYPNRKVKSVKFLLSVSHGSVGVQEYNE